ncbi:hypothetical protein ACFL16_03305, partial [Patescibacteria group bacterium]
MEFRESRQLPTQPKNEEIQKPESKLELLDKIQSIPPAIESLTNPEEARKIWPEGNTKNEVFIEQVTERNELISNLQEVTEKIPQPDISLEDAMSNNYITEEQVINLYGSLSKLIDSDDYKRVILYLPFEFLPSKDWQPSSEHLQAASGQFEDSYMSAWKKLLTVHDVRANFINGDVLEIEKRIGDLPRVVKAAHLIPKLVEKGMIEFDEVLQIAEQSNDQTLKDSIIDTFSTLSDLGLLTEKEIELMKKSQDQLVKNTATLLSLDLGLTSSKPESIIENPTLSSIQEKLATKFSQIDMANYGDVTKKREAWLKETE